MRLRAKRRLPNGDSPASPIPGGCGVVHATRMDRAEHPGRVQDRPAETQLQRSHERHDVLLLLRCERETEHKVEELHRVIQRHQPIVVQVRRRVLDAA